MKVPTMDEMRHILETRLAEDYPGQCVELGECWELIAEIFFKEGYDAALSDTQ